MIILLDKKKEEEAAMCWVSSIEVGFGKSFISLGLKRLAVAPFTPCPVFINKPKQI